MCTCVLLHECIQQYGVGKSTLSCTECEAEGNSWAKIEQISDLEKERTFYLYIIQAGGLASLTPLLHVIRKSFIRNCLHIYMLLKSTGLHERADLCKSEEVIVQ